MLSVWVYTECVNMTSLHTPPPYTPHPYHPPLTRVMSLLSHLFVPQHTYTHVYLYFAWAMQTMALALYTNGTSPFFYRKWLFPSRLFSCIS